MQNVTKNGELAKKFSGLLRDNTKLLDQIFKSLLDSNNGIIIIITENQIEFANHQAIKSFGYSLKELQNQQIDKFFLTNHKVPFRNYLAYTTGKRKTEPDQILIKVESKGGGGKWYKPNIKRCLWKAKNSLLLQLDDGGDEKSFEPVSSSRLHDALLATNQGIWDVNYQTGDIYVSPECFLLLGYKPNEIKQTLDNWRKLIHHDFVNELDDVDNKLRKGLISEHSFEFKSLSKSGDYVWLQSVGRVVEWDRQGTPIRIVGIIMNIDKKKKTEIEKDETRSTLEELTSKMKDGLSIISQGGIILEWNPAMEKITQIKKNQAIGKYIWDVQQPFIEKSEQQKDHIEKHKKIFQNIAQTGQVPWDNNAFDTEITMKDGQKKIVQNVLFPIHTKNEIKIVATLRDVTESKISRIKLEKSEERLKLALSAGRVGIWDVDLISGDKYFSPICFQILGYMPWEYEPSQEVWINLIHPQDRPEVEEKIQVFQKEGTLLEMVFRMKKKGGEYVWIESKNRVSRNEVGKIERITGTISDITYRKEIEFEQSKHKEELQLNLSRHEFLSEISIILNTNENLSVKINEVLTKLGWFTNSGRVYILENTQDQRYTTNTFEWVAEGIESQKENQKQINLDMILEWIEGRVYYSSSNLIADMPSDLAEFMISQGVQSCLILPLYSEDNLFGFIGFDEYYYPKTWKKLEIELLQTISNLISFAFEKEKAYNTLVNNELRLREITEMLPHIVFDVTLTGKIEFLNKAGCKYFGLTESDIKKGILLKDLFPETELYRMSLIREDLKRTIIREPLVFEAEPAHRKGEMLKILVTPKTVKTRITGYTGIAILDIK